MALTIPTSTTLLPEPLTTVWTYPTECASKTPFILGGSCVELACEQVGTMLTDYAFVNYPYESAPVAIESSSCWPPDFLYLAYYSPAVACPAGYVTASTGPSIEAQVTTGYESYVFCCPSQFPYVFTTYGWSACMTTSTVSEATGLPIAMDVYLTAPTPVTDQIATPTYYKTQSTVGTYYYIGNEVVTLFHPPVGMYIPEAMKQDADQSGPKGFTVFGLSHVISITVITAIAIAGLISLCCFCCFCSSCCSANGKRTDRTPRYETPRYEMQSSSQGRAWPVQTVPSGESTDDPYEGPNRISSSISQPRASMRKPPPAPPPPLVSPCRHAARIVCRDLRGTPQQCCTCRDKRPGILPKAQRLEICCQQCQLFWQVSPSTSCPPEWKLDQLQCPHKRSHECDEVNSSEASCCVCKDDRTQRLAKRERLRPYCESCTTFWEQKPVQELPPNWKLICGHVHIGKRCVFALTEDVGCCACTDSSTGDISKERRISSYCQNCKSAWTAMADKHCPPEWKLKCPHNRALAREATEPPRARTRTGPCCCACRDSSKGYKSKKHRLMTYCLECRMLWERTPDAECPKEWGMSGCVHDGLSRTCERPGPTRDNCCACTDTRKDPIQKAKRIKSYCASCQKSWSRRSDATCPSGWQLEEVQIWTTACPTHPAVRCFEQTTFPVPGCCACRDLKKKGTILHRSAGYCSECSIYWNEQPPQAWPFPVSLTDEWLNQAFPTLKLLPNGEAPGAQVAFPNETAPNFQLLDEGPRYGPVRLGNDNPINQPSPSSTTSMVPAPSFELPAEVLGYGPSRLASDNPINQASPSITASIVPEPNPERHPEEKSSSPQNEAPRGAHPLTREERQRQRDREGLQYGAPQFSVGLDGMLK